MARGDAQERDRRIVAQTDTNMFGGSFTPFRDLWNTLATDLGITTKRMRQDAFTRAAQEEAIWRDTSSAISDELSRQRQAASSPEALAQLRALDGQLEQANRMRQSSDPVMRAAGIDLLGKVTAEQRAFGQRQEAQAIARDAAEAVARKELGNERWSRFTTLYDDLHRESADFLTIQASYRALEAAYSGEDEPGNAQDIAAINSLQRMIDPGVSVREGDVSLLQNMAGVPDWVITAANRVVREGGRFSPAERKSMAALGRQLMAAANAKQSDTNARFQTMGQAGELPAQYVTQLAVPIVDVGGPDTGNYGEVRPLAPGDPATKPASSGPLRETAPAVPTTGELIGESIASGVATAGNNAADIIAGATGFDVRKPLELIGKGAKAVGRGASSAAAEAGNLRMPELGGVSESIDTDEQGMSRGVYVPEFMRRRRAQRRAVND